MKKNIIILGIILVILGLVAVSSINWNTDESGEVLQAENIAISSNVTKKIDKIIPKFIYGIGPRFSPIKKSAIKKLKSVSNFLDEKEWNEIEQLKSVSVIVIKNDKQSDIREYGTTKDFNKAQLLLIESFNYSTNFVIRAEYLQKNKETGNLEHSYSTPHLTVVPEKQAIYKDGKEALMNFLRENSKDTWANINPEKLQPAKLFFTVSKTGTIKNIRLDRSSNFPEVDSRIKALLKIVPGEWIPAQNTKGENVAQELVVSFGLMGC